MRIAIAVALVVMTTGCAIGNRYAYHGVVANPRLTGSSMVAVATHDQRAYVRSGDKSPRFVGLQRGGFGNPFDVTTADERPLADAITTAIVNTLTRKGFRAQPVVVTHVMSPAEVQRALQGVETERAVVLTLHEWKSDTAVRVGLGYDVGLRVLDRTGTVLAEKRLQGRDNLGGVMVPSQVEEKVMEALKTRLEQLLDDPAVTTALGGS